MQSVPATERIMVPDGVGQCGASAPLTLTGQRAGLCPNPSAPPTTAVKPRARRLKQCSWCVRFRLICEFFVLNLIDSGQAFVSYATQLDHRTGVSISFQPYTPQEYANGDTDRRARPSRYSQGEYPVFPETMAPAVLSNGQRAP